MFSPAQHNSTFPSNYIEFPRTGMKVVMHEASNIPWECVMFQTGAHAILSTRGFCDNAPKKRTFPANALYRLAIFRMRKLPLSLRPASINYLILKGLIIPFFFSFFFKSTYNVFFVPKGSLDIILEKNNNGVIPTFQNITANLISRAMMLKILFSTLFSHNAAYSVR